LSLHYVLSYLREEPRPLLRVVMSRDGGDASHVLLNYLSVCCHIQ
jgi:hypothetical protein